MGDIQSINEVFDLLKSRLRNVRVCCGDWSRVTGERVVRPKLTTGGYPVGIFFDPPYDNEEGVYANSHSVYSDVLKWNQENYQKENYRIVVCGYSGMWNPPMGWREVTWSGNGFSKQTRPECLWISPQCLPVDGEQEPNRSVSNEYASLGDFDDLLLNPGLHWQLREIPLYFMQSRLTGMTRLGLLKPMEPKTH